MSGVWTANQVFEFDGNATAGWGPVLNPDFQEQNRSVDLHYFDGPKSLEVALAEVLTEKFGEGFTGRVRIVVEAFPPEVHGPEQPPGVDSFALQCESNLHVVFKDCTFEPPEFVDVNRGIEVRSRAGTTKKD